MNPQQSNFKLSNMKRSMLTVFVIGLAVGTVQAGCWEDLSMTSLATSLAQRGFPTAAKKMPDVLVCDNADFRPGVGDDYTGGSIHRIRLPVEQSNRPETATILAHELGHAETWLTGGSDVNGGHSSDFMRVLLRACWGPEAQRVAQHVPGAQFALNEARSNSITGASRPTFGALPHGVDEQIPTYVTPTVQVLVCTAQPVAFPGRDGGAVHVVIQQFCQWLRVSQ